MPRLRHPLHPAVVHFPVALWTAAVLCDGLALAGAAGPWWLLAWWALLGGTLAAVPAIATGFWELARLGAAFPALGVASAHMMAMGVAAGLFFASLMLRGGPEAPPAGVTPWTPLVLDALGLACLAAGGWLGAELVYRHGAGRRDPPAPGG